MISASLQSKIPQTVTTFCVGSLPFKNADEAVDFVRSHPWILPFWPELPQKDPAEFMVPRSDRALQAAWQGYSANEASGLFATLKSFEDKPLAVPVIKGQLLGPLSHAFFSEELEGDFSKKLRTASIACLRQMEWQIETLSKVGRDVVLVLDEPGFVYWGKLTAQEKDLVKEQLTYLYVSAGERNCYLGIHSCAPLEPHVLAFPADLFSVDALLPGARELLTVARGGRHILVPGVVAAAKAEDFESELRRGHALLLDITKAAGPSTRLLFAANCGHGLASESWVKFLYQAPDKMAQGV